MITLDKEKKYLITGGSGYLGHELVKRLTEMGITNLRVLARDEGKLIALKELYPNIEIIPGSIVDPFICKKACEGVSGIFHLAAFKHVGLSEQNPRECILTNVVGSENLLEESAGKDFILGVSSDAASKVPKLDFVLGVSTDKASRVSGIYGSSKFLMEGLFREYEKLNPSTKYRLVKFGNVMYSTGSVLCKWKEKLQAGEEVLVTDLNATRFYITVSKAVDTLLECLEKAEDSTPFSINMKSTSVGELLNVMVEKYLPEGKELKAKVIGLQVGENLHEISTEDYSDSFHAERYTQEELREMV